jgi:hypothetical protein
VFAFDDEPFWDLRPTVVSKLLRKLISALRRDGPGLIEHRGMPNLWEEMCVQVREEHPLTEMYLDHARKRLDPLVRALSSRERFALWLGSYDSEGVRDSDEAVSLTLALARADPDDLTRRFVHEEVTPLLWNYETKRIREAVWG